MDSAYNYSTLVTFSTSTTILYARFIFVRAYYKNKVDQTSYFKQTLNLCALAKRVENSSKFRSFVRWVLHTQKSWQKKPWVKCFQTQVTSVAEIVQLSTQSPQLGPHCKSLHCNSVQCTRTVINLRSNTFCNPIFQKGLQN